MTVTSSVTSSVKILAFSGSLRKESHNTKVVRVAAEGAREAGAAVTVIELRDLPMPLYDEDLEASSGMPPHAKTFKKLLIEHDGLLIASPEYNSSVSAALKNAIDWASRPEPGEPPLVAFAGKVAGLLAASPGGLGGLRGLVTLRSILSNIRVLVLPEQVAVVKSHEALDAAGSFKDAKQADSVKEIGARVAALCRRLKA